MRPCGVLKISAPTCRLYCPAWLAYGRPAHMWTGLGSTAMSEEGVLPFLRTPSNGKPIGSNRPGGRGTRLPKLIRKERILIRRSGSTLHRGDDQRPFLPANEPRQHAGSCLRMISALDKL